MVIDSRNGDTTTLNLKFDLVELFELSSCFKYESVPPGSLCSHICTNPFSGADEPQNRGGSPRIFPNTSTDGDIE